jgi:hypothetical protein
MWILCILNSKQASLAMAVAAALAWTPHLAALQAPSVRVTPTGSTLTEVLDAPLADTLPKTLDHAALNVTVYKLSPRSGPFDLVLRVFWEPTEYPGTFGLFRRMEIVRTSDGRRVQVLEEPSGVCFFSPESFLGVNDLNFDGNLDLKILTSSGSGGQNYDCWLYNPAQGRFVFSLELTNVGNPDPHPETGQISAAGRNWMSRYRYLGGKLTLVWNRSEEWRSKGLFEVTQELIDGEMRVVKEELLEPASAEIEDEP